MSKYNLVDIAEGMGYKEYEDAKEADRLEAHPESAKIKAAQAMMAKEKAGIKEDEEYSNHRDRLRKTMRLVFDIVRKYDLDAEDVMDELGEEFNVPFEFGRAGGIEENIIKEEEGFVEVSKDEIKMHLDQYRDGNIDGDDLANAVEEIVFSRMDESFDSLAKKLDKQKGIDKEEAGKIAGSIAAKKMAGAGKGPTAKQKKRMSEADAIPTSAGEMKRGDDGKMYNVIASNAERKMAMRSVIDILRDELSVSQDDAFDYIKTHRDDLFDGTVDAFDRDDVVDDYKNYESVNEASDTFNIDKVASPDAKAHDYGDEIKGISDEDDTEEKYAHQTVLPLEEEGKVDFIRSLKVDGNGTKMEIKSYLESLKRSGDKFDSVDDYVEDFKNYVEDKSLREHFGRFMKDYQ